MTKIVKKSERNSWPPETNAWLITNWATAKKKDLAEHCPGAAVKACAEQVQRLRTMGVQIPYSPRFEQEPGSDWTAEETRTLLAIYATATNEELRKAIPNKTLSQCSSKASHLRSQGFNVPKRQRERHSPGKYHRPTQLQTDKTKPGKNGCPGVSFKTSTRMWRAQIGFNYKQYVLGHFDRKEDAIAMRCLVNEAVEPIIERLNKSATRLRDNGDTAALKRLYDKTTKDFEQAIEEVMQEMQTRRYAKKSDKT